MTTVISALIRIPPISAKLKNPFKKTKRKARTKRITLPRLAPTLKRAIFSLASSAFLPPALNFLNNGGNGFGGAGGSWNGRGGGGGGDGGVWPGGGSDVNWWFGKRRRSRLNLAKILRLIFSLSAGSALGLNAQEVRVFGLGFSGLKNGALCFLLGFVVCFLICEGIVLGRKKGRNWGTKWRM